MSGAGAGRGVAPRPRIDRRTLGRALSRLADASVEDALTTLAESAGTGPARDDVWRCGVTGPAGAGKSTLVGRLAAARLERGRRVGVVAIDPSSPRSRGAILGDRIRIDAYADHPELFVRSLASRRATDGLADNLANVMALLAGHGFDDLLVETVGAGQSQYEIRQLADTVIVVLMPGAGDLVQAIKAGILECGDIYAVNKADRPGGQEMAAEIASVVAAGEADGWSPPVIAVSALGGEGIEALEAAAERHRGWQATHVDRAEAARRRLRAHVRSLAQRRLAEVLDAGAADEARSVPAGFHAVLAALAHATAD